MEIKQQIKPAIFCKPISPVFVKTLRRWREEQNEDYKFMDKYIKDSYKY